MAKKINHFYDIKEKLQSKLFKQGFLEGREFERDKIWQLILDATGKMEQEILKKLFPKEK